MKIATFNVNGITARLPSLLRWLEEFRPDIACLQELKAPQERFPEAAIRNAGYGVVWHGQKSWNGVAILAREAQPVEQRRVLPGDPEDLHSRYIEPPSATSSSDASTCPTAIPRRDRSSTTSCAGSTA
jgi:exodeoxyribonuclease-3